MANVRVNIPDIGDFKDVEVIELLVKVGDTVSQEQSLITVESDKASMEIPSSTAGVIKKIMVKLGDKVNQGDALVEVEAGAGAVAPAQEITAQAAPAVAPAAVAAVQSPAPVPVAPPAKPLATADTSVYVGKLAYASPSVRKFARELGVAIEQVKGSGEKGRIVIEDVKSFVKASLAGGVATGAKSTGGVGLDLLAWPKVDFTKFGEIERQALSRIKKISGANLHRNWVMIPHVTNNDQADITDLEALRVQLNQENLKQGIKTTMLAFLIKAVVAALKKYPEFNTSLDGDELIYKKYYHIGFAADTPNGLVVPVIKDADKKGILEISQEMAQLAKQARDGKLSPSAMTGGCFSISSLGGIGGGHFTPIINAPEVAILGVGRSTMQPVWNGKEFRPKLILPLSLSYDHRVIDGAAAARFNAFLVQVLADFRRICL